MGRTNVIGGTGREFYTQHDREVLARILLGEAKRLLARPETIPDQLDDCITAPYDQRIRPGYLAAATRPEVIDPAPIERIRAELMQDIDRTFATLRARR
jgi:hypothetical protein